jgi:hypothetical protein
MVEYTYRTGYRVIRHLKNAEQARSFYDSQDKLGNNPRFLEELKMSEIPTDTTTPIVTKPARTVKKRAKTKKTTVKKTTKAAKATKTTKAAKAKKTTKSATGTTTDRQLAKDLGLKLPQLKIVRAMQQRNSPVSYNDIKEDTGYYSTLTALMRSEHNDSLCELGITTEEVVETNSNGSGKLHFKLTAKGKKLKVG